MPPVESREQYRDRTKPVTIVNQSEHTIVISFNGVEYEFGPNEGERFPQEVAWHVFGNPNLRKNGEKAWNEELRGVQLRNGGGDEGATGRNPGPQPTNWELIQAGSFYCQEFGKGAEFYKITDTRRRTRERARPLEEIFAVGARQLDSSVLSVLKREYLDEAMDAVEQNTSDVVATNPQLAPRKGKRGSGFQIPEAQIEGKFDWNEGDAKTAMEVGGLKG